MKKTSVKLITIVLALVLICGTLAACGGKKDPADDGTTDAPAQKCKIGVVQLVEHVALDAAT